MSEKNDKVLKKTKDGVGASFCLSTAEIMEMAKALDNNNRGLYLTYDCKDEMLDYLQSLGGDISGLEGADGETIAEKIVERKDGRKAEHPNSDDAESSDTADTSADEKDVPVVPKKDDNPPVVPKNFTLDAKFTAATWKGKCSKTVMLYLLGKAGVDATEYGHLKQNELAVYIVERRKRMESENEG